MLGWLFGRKRNDESKQSGIGKLKSIETRHADEAIAHLRNQALDSLELLPSDEAHALANDVWEHREPYECSDKEALLAILQRFIENELLGEGALVRIKRCDYDFDRVGLDVQGFTPATNMIQVYRVWAVEGGGFLVKASHEPVTEPIPSLGPYGSVLEILREPWDANGNSRYELEGARQKLEQDWRKTLPLLIPPLAETENSLDCVAFCEALVQILKNKPKSHSQFVEELAKLPLDEAKQVLDRVLFSKSNCLFPDDVEWDVLQRCALSPETCGVALALIDDQTGLASHYTPIAAKAMLDKGLSQELRESAAEVMQHCGIGRYSDEPLLPYDEAVAWWKNEGSRKDWS